MKRRPMALRSALVAALALAGTIVTANAQTRLVTWNIGNLHDRLGVPLRKGAAIREAQDIALLKKMQNAISGHVYALQEINGPKAARLIFDATEFDLCVSSRFQADIDRGFSNPVNLKTDRIYTILAIRKGHFDKVDCFSIEDLGIVHYEKGEPPREARRAAGAHLTRNGKTITVVSVHMKSRCFGKSLGPTVDGENANPHCRTFERMANTLEAWSDNQVELGRAVIIAGDFNRRLNLHHGGAPGERRDHFFLDLNDNTPPGATYLALPQKTAPTPPPRKCFAHQKGLTGFHFPHPIDFVLANEKAKALIDPASLKEFDYKQTLQSAYDDQRNKGREAAKLSDHCPLAVTINF